MRPAGELLAADLRGHVDEPVRVEGIAGSGGLPVELDPELGGLGGEALVLGDASSRECRTWPR